MIQVFPVKGEESSSRADHHGRKPLLENLRSPEKQLRLCLCQVRQQEEACSRSVPKAQLIPKNSKVWELPV